MTLWYVGVMTVLLLACTVALSLRLSHGMQDLVDASLRDQIRLIEARLRAAERGADLPEPMGQLTIAPAFVELITPEGEIADVAASFEAVRVPVREQMLERARQRRTHPRGDAHA